MPTLLSKLFRALHRHVQLVPRHHIYHHIESGGGERISLRRSSIPLKSRPTIPARPCHHRHPPPLSPEDPTCSGDHTLTLQDLKAPGPVQGIIRLVQVQEFRR